jgi:DNA polymerase III epsilon subunit-like protein
VACVPIVDGVPEPGWSSLVRPARPIPSEATGIHHITDEMVRDAPEPGAVAAIVSRECGRWPLVLHNAPFDLPFIAALLRAGGCPPLASPVIDTLGLARGAPDPGGGVPGLGEHSLGALARRFRLPLETAHRAAGDARTTARIFCELALLWERGNAAHSVAELAAESQDVVRRTRRERGAAAGPGLTVRRAPETLFPLAGGDPGHSGVAHGDEPEEP